MTKYKIEIYRNKDQTIKKVKDCPDTVDDWTKACDFEDGLNINREKYWTRPREI